MKSTNNTLFQSQNTVAMALPGKLCLLQFSRLRQREMRPLTWLLFYFRYEVVCPGFVTHVNRIQKVILFVHIVAEKFMGRVYLLLFVVFCQHSWDPCCAHPPSKSDKWWFEKPLGLKRRNHPERPADVYAWFPQPSLPSCWWSPTWFFIVNFSATKCKLPTPLSDVLYIHAWLAIHFSQ